MNHSRSILRTSPICFGATKNFTVLLSSVSGVLRIRSTRSEEHTSELQSQSNLVCRLLLEKKNVFHVDFYETFLLAVDNGAIHMMQGQGKGFDRNFFGAGLSRIPSRAGDLGIRIRPPWAVY